DPAQRYIEILREELAQGRAVLCDQPTTEPRGPGDAEVIGYRDDEYAYLLPEASRKRVSASLRAAGEAWSVTAKTLHTSLVKKRIVLPGSEGRPQTKRSFGGTRVRVLTVPLSILWDRPPAPDAPAPAAPPANENGAVSARQTPWLNKGLDEAAPPAPGAPHLGPVAGGSLAAEEE
ncbi:MAG: hypothetical protein QOD39_867, partial [Mycobacterium sp.]|nr:hypothetical protein [Mycobacterium sp.]